MTTKVRTKQLLIVWILLDTVNTLEHVVISRSPDNREPNASTFQINNQLNHNHYDLSEIKQPLYNTNRLLRYDSYMNSNHNQSISSWRDDNPFYESEIHSSFAKPNVFFPNETSKNSKIETIGNNTPFNISLQSDDNSMAFEPPLSPADPPSDLYTLPLQSSDLLPVIDSFHADPLNKFLAAPVVPYNMEGSEIIEPEFIVPDDVAFAPPVPPAFVKPVKTYALTINDGTVKRNEVRKDNGEYISSYTSADGTWRSESARLIKTSTGEEVLVYKGSYSFATPDGQKFRVDYTADRDGFRSTTTPVTAKPTQGSSTAQPNSQGSSPQSQRPYQRPPQRPQQQPTQYPYQQPPQKPYQQQSQKPYQQPPQNPYQQPPQKPYQQPAQKPYQQPSQNPYQQPTQKPYQQPPQKPYQQPPQKPYQQPPQKPYQQPPQKPYQQPYQKPYQQPPQKPYTQTYQNPYQQPYQNPYQQQSQNHYQQTSQNSFPQPPQKPYQKPLLSSYQQQSQNPYQQNQQPLQTPQTHPIPVRPLPSNSTKRPNKPPPYSFHKPMQIPIIVLPKPHLQGHSRLPLVQPNKPSSKPPVYIKLPQKPIPQSTNDMLAHPIPPIPNMHRPIKG